METSQSTGLKRNIIDKYYTKPNIVEMCLGLFTQNIQLCATDLIIEPSAGNGAFIDAIKSISQNYIFYDIEPEHPEIIQQDYLCAAVQAAPATRVHIIGNPPFGRQSSAAIKFIKKSCKFCNTVAFILPKSFKKQSMQRAFPTQFHLVYEVDLPPKSFIVNTTEWNVETIFQIWERREYDRETAPRVEPHGFTFVRRSEKPDISVRRVGVYAGKIDTRDLEEKSIQSHYFIKFTDTAVAAAAQQLQHAVRFCHNNTVGPRSISKGELITEFNRVLAAAAAHT